MVCAIHRNARAVRRLGGMAGIPFTRWEVGPGTGAARENRGRFAAWEHPIRVALACLAVSARRRGGRSDGAPGAS
ncbi:hypothetical protein GCM10010517_65060 [Streptosporangium fragile]|uniref:Uncharacterized protein n=1 Tax=Streptosporangium fragile TaxID=46186 RepID=A0ABN3W701_9ACTN